MNGTTKEDGTDVGITLSFNETVRSKLQEVLKDKARIAGDTMQSFLESPSSEGAEQLKSNFQALGDFSYQLAYQLGLIYEATKMLQAPTVPVK